MRYCLIAVALALLGCGPPADNSDLSGTWSGVTTVIFSGLDPISFQGSLGIQADGERALVSGFCPMGQGALMTPINGTQFSWEGIVVCPQSVAFPDCKDVRFTFLSARGSVYKSIKAPPETGSVEKLGVNASGYGDGCGTSRSATLSFSGQRY